MLRTRLAVVILVLNNGWASDTTVGGGDKNISPSNQPSIHGVPVDGCLVLGFPFTPGAYIAVNWACLGVTGGTVHKVWARVAFVLAVCNDSPRSAGCAATTSYITIVPVSERTYNAMDRASPKGARLHFVKFGTLTASVESLCDFAAFSDSSASLTTASGALGPSAILAYDTIDGASLAIAYFHIFANGASFAAKRWFGCNFALA